MGPAIFRTLVNEFGGAAAAIAALPLLSRRGGRSDIRLCTEAEAEAELALAESLGASLVAIGEPGYPPALAQVDSPPPLLYVKGRLELADIPMVAIVGARNCSAVGQKFRRSPPISRSKDSSSPRASPAASTPPRTWPRSIMAPSPCWPAAPGRGEAPRGVRYEGGGGAGLGHLRLAEEYGVCGTAPSQPAAAGRGDRAAPRDPV